MSINNRILNDDRFIIDSPDIEIDTKKIIKILQEIKELKNAFPHVKIASRSNYEELRISNIREHTDHAMELKYEKFSWVVVNHQLALGSASFEASTNLQDSIRNYILLLDNLDPFYSSLQALDDICILGDPQEITLKTCWRLVKFSKEVFIRIEFLNPLCVDEVSVSFHGTTRKVKEMTDTYNSSSCDDYDGTIYQKLLNIFEIPYFPATDEDTIDCSMCLSYRCENDRCPIVHCDNSVCNSVFHSSCLEKYLKVQNHLKILNVSFMKCPYCQQTISNTYAQFFQQ